MRQVIAELSKADREILLMRNLEMLSNQETAQVLGLKSNAASQRYGRALLKLRKLLAAHGVEDAQP